MVPGKPITSMGSVQKERVVIVGWLQAKLAEGHYLANQRADCADPVVCNRSPAIRYQKSVRRANVATQSSGQNLRPVSRRCARSPLLNDDGLGKIVVDLTRDQIIFANAESDSGLRGLGSPG
jgi:hypothetical protein